MRQYFRTRPILFILMLSFMSVSFAGCDATAIINAVKKIIEGVSEIGKAITGSSSTTSSTKSADAKTGKTTDSTNKSPDAKTDANTDTKTDTKAETKTGNETDSKKVEKSATPISSISPTKETASEKKSGQ